MTQRTRPYCSEDPLSTTNQLTDKVALVTGGSRNIGRHTAIALANRGAEVIVTYRERRDAAERTVDELETLGTRAAALQVDLTGTKQIPQLVASVKEILRDWSRSGLDILVNNAGVMRMATFDKVTEADIDINFETNYKAVFFLTQQLADVLADGGRIVNLGSRTAGIAFAPLASYGPSKAAVQALTIYLAAHFGPRGITVNAVAPGGLDDDFNEPLFTAMPAARSYITTNTAIRRIGAPQDVAEVIAFLCTPAASFISGSILNIDGGYHL